MKHLLYVLTAIAELAAITFSPVMLNADVHNIAIMNYVFSPDTLIVFQDDSVRWINQGSVNHTTTSGVNGVPDSIWDSGLMAPGDSFMFHFTAVGDYPYYCTPHWQMGMIGLISVIATNVEETVPYQENARLMLTYPTVIRTGVDFMIDTKGARGISLCIYDSQGSLIRKIRQGFDNREISAPAVHWNLEDAQGRRAKPGAYFFRITADGKSSAGKLVLVE